MKRLFPLVYVILAVLTLSACGSEQLSGSGQGMGGITATAVWPGSSSSAKAGAMHYKAPAGVAWVRMVVSNGTTSLSADFAAAAGSGSVSGVPAGTGWTLTFQGLNAAKDAIYFQGYRSGITVTAGATTNVGNVAMYVNSSMSGIYENAAMMTFGSGNSYASDLAIRPDGKILVTGRADLGFNDQFTTIQYLSSGNLDTTFGAAGSYVASYPIGTSSIAEGLALQQDGRFIVVGHQSDPLGSAAVIARYTADGTSFDNSFATTGYDSRHIGNNTKAYDVKIQSDGSIVVAGDADPSVNFNYDFMILKYGPTGTLITSATTTFGASTVEHAYALALGADDSIYVAGDVWNTDQDIGIVKYTSTGAFVSKTTITLSPGFDDNARAIAVQPDGKVVVAGRTMCGAIPCIGLVRLTSTLELDPTFGGGDGKVTLTLNGYLSASASAIRIQPDGKIVTFGLAENQTAVRWDYALARFLDTGVLDTSFNPGGTQPGVVTTSVGLGINMNRLVQGMGLGINSDGKILAAANARPTTIDGFAVAQYWNDVTTKAKIYGVGGSQLAVESTSFTAPSTTFYSLHTVQTPSYIASNLVNSFVDPTANRLYISDNTVNRVFVVDTINNMTIASIPVGSGPGHLRKLPGSNRLYVSNNTGNTVSVIDTSDNTVLPAISGFSGPRGMAYDPNTNRLYVVNGTGNTVSVIDTLTDTIIPSATLSDFNDPVTAAFDASSGKLFVTNQGADTVSAITISTGARTEIAVGNGPFRMTMNSGTQRLYVTNFGGGSGNTVSVINISTNAVILSAQITVGAGARSISLNTSSNLLYVDCTGDLKVHVINVVGDGTTEVGTLAGGGNHMTVVF